MLVAPDRFAGLADFSSQHLIHSGISVICKKGM
jgi:hypothetical protein